MQLPLGGKQRGLKFNMGTLKFIGELTGGNPLNFNVDTNDLSGIYNTAKTIIHAALLSNCLSKRENADFDAEDVDAWVSELSMHESTAVLNAFAAANQSEPEPDKKKQTVKR